MYVVTSAEFTPENFIAGSYPIVKDFGTVAAGNIIKKHEPVKLINGEILPVTAIAESAADETNVIPAKTEEENTVEGLYGIAAEDAEESEEVVVYLTGQFFTDAIMFQSGVTADTLKPAFRKLGIFLKEINNNG